MKREIAVLNGKIKAYNEERGFGFIEVEGEKKDIFFHIKDLPNKQIAPKIGEKIQFNKSEENGKFRAINIYRLDIKVETERHTPQSRAAQQRSAKSNNSVSHRPKKQTNWIGSICFFAIIALGIGIYQKINQEQKDDSQSVYTAVSQSETQVKQNFRCDGRQHCSEMRSYDEALYFNKNCPDTKMDGNHDGIPCEKQFSEEISKRHLFR